MASAQSYTPVITSPGPVAPGGSYTVVVTNCVPGQTVTFTQAQSSPSTVTSVCSSPSQAALPSASGAFTAAPTAVGSYTGTAAVPQSASLPFSVVVQAEVASEAIPGQAPTTTFAPVTTAPPVTSPGGGLPATGSDGIGTTTMIALGFLAVGGGLFIVAQVRRRQEQIPA